MLPIFSLFSLVNVLTSPVLPAPAIAPAEDAPPPVVQSISQSSGIITIPQEVRALPGGLDSVPV
ncbi:MAG: hypothetical protein WBA01_18035, partial [Phormidesmis sp.]